MNSPAPIPEALPELSVESVQEPQETLPMDNDEILSGILLDDGFLTPMMNSVFDSSEVDDQALLPPEPFDQTKADLQMEAILTGVQSEVEISSDPDQVLEMPTNGNPHCPVTGEQRDGVLDTTVVAGTTLIINRGRLLPDYER